MEISIQKPKPEHAEAIASICARGWRQTVEGKLSAEYQRKNIEHWYHTDRVTKDIQNGAYTYIASAGNNVAGVIGGAPTGPEEGEIFVLYVDEHYRYQGIGRKLLKALTDDQLKEGVKRQWVSVQEDNQYGLPFYQARGFVFDRKRVTQTETGEEQVSLRFWRSMG
ncbi:GNAT family N-acetyltransferase [Virgibacillus sp. MSP4-1]|uniref:GNAT family N-acetyltransferase n=1 Tax=Virgibacillus sp. MSP4-1 TaxID=2700081 RepID=UPI0003A92B53|nr:GNAT family N-acetyltransferase [Virgibacillus sp. MSP4-1]QHS22024.1 GNAT family N-acetyltransferase [Virgibacillus sp. MSP4-1]